MNILFGAPLLSVQVLSHMEDVKVREMQIFDYKKKIAEADTKLRQQQNLYEAVRSDRNLYSKNLIESQVGLLSLLFNKLKQSKCIWMEYYGHVLVNHIQRFRLYKNGWSPRRRKCWTRAFNLKKKPNKMYQNYYKKII